VTRVATLPTSKGQPSPEQATDTRLVVRRFTTEGCTGDHPGPRLETISITEYTIDGHKVTKGMRVWDYDLNRAIVGEEKPYSPGWFEMTTPEGKRSSMMNGSRMWVRHPMTGERA